jgi:hypothetical protein
MNIIVGKTDEVNAITGNVKAKPAIDVYGKKANNRLMRFEQKEANNILNGRYGSMFNKYAKAVALRTDSSFFITKLKLKYYR